MVNEPIQQWEYLEAKQIWGMGFGGKWKIVSSDYSRYLEPLTLNDLGVLGWELAGVYTVAPDLTNMGYYCAIFKRPLRPVEALKNDSFSKEKLLEQLVTRSLIPIPGDIIEKIQSGQLEIKVYPGSLGTLSYYVVMPDDPRPVLVVTTEEHPR